MFFEELDHSTSKGGGIVAYIPFILKAYVRILKLYGWNWGLDVRGHYNNNKNITKYFKNITKYF